MYPMTFSQPAIRLRGGGQRERLRACCKRRRSFFGPFSRLLAVKNVGQYLNRFIEVIADRLDGNPHPVGNFSLPETQGVMQHERFASARRDVLKGCLHMAKLFSCRDLGLHAWLVSRDDQRFEILDGLNGHNFFVPNFVYQQIRAVVKTKDFVDSGICLLAAS